MNPQALQERDQIAGAYLEQLEGLALEISIAMDAIAANALHRFQESVAKQETLCFSLAQIANTVAKGQPSVQRTFYRYDPAVDEKIQAASEAIRKLNLRYAALLRHSGKSIALLGFLCRNYLGNSQEARGARLKRQTWSCEM